MSQDQGCGGGRCGAGHITSSLTAVCCFYLSPHPFSANGTALARRFAESGRRVAMLARNKERVEALAASIAGARGFECDVSDASSVEACFAAVAREFGDVDTLLYNAGTGVFADVESITVEQFEQAWRVNAFGSLLCAREVIPAMKAKGAGDIVFIGATASRRGGKMTAAFAPAKAAQRSLAESMARSLGPAGIHVALIVVDGVVDLEKTRARDARQAGRLLHRSCWRRRDCLAAYAAVAPGVELRG